MRDPAAPPRAQSRLPGRPKARVTAAVRGDPTQRAAPECRARRTVECRPAPRVHGSPPDVPAPRRTRRRPLGGAGGRGRLGPRPVTFAVTLAETQRRHSAEKIRILFAKKIFFESAFVVNSTNPMVSCERSVVAVAHTHTPRRTARPPAAPPRRERDEEMGQRRRSPNTYGRVQ